MRSKKFWAILIAVMLVTALTMGLVSCKKDEETPPTKEVVWQDYLNDVGKAFDNTYSVNFGKDFNFDASLDLKYADANEGAAQSFDKTLKLSANINLNDTGTAGKNLLALEYGDKGVTEADKRFSLYADNQNIYLNMYGAKLKLENAEVFTAVKGLIGTVYDTNTKITGFADILYAVGFMVFEGGSVNADKTVYSFDFSLKKIVDVVMPLLEESLDAETKEAIFGIVGATTLEEFMANIPAIKGKIDFNLAGDKFVGVGVSNVDFSFESAKMQGTFDASLKVNNLSNTIDTTLAARIPAADDATYTTAKIGAVRGNGTLQFMTANKTFVNYDWSLESNIDVVSLLVGKVLGDDNYFHFRLSHTCDTNCGAYCDSKYIKEDGVVLDLAYSPKDFGTQYIYAAVSLQKLIGPANIDALAKGMGGVVTFAIAPYSLFAIDTSSFAYADTPLSIGYTPPTAVADMGIDLSAITKIIKPILSVIKGINAEELSLTIDLKDILGALGQGAILDTVNQLLTVPSQPLDQIKFDIDMIRFNDPQYATKNIKDEVLYSKGDNVPGTKMFESTPTPASSIALKWAPTVDKNGNAYIYIDGAVEADDKMTGTLAERQADYDNKMHEFDTVTGPAMLKQYVDGGVPEENAKAMVATAREKLEKPLKALVVAKTPIESALTPAEVRALIGGGYIQYKINAINDLSGTPGAKTHKRMPITGISGIDYTKFNVPQKVKIMTAVPGSYLADEVKSALKGFIVIDSIIYTTVDATITLTEEIDFNVDIKEKDSTFAMGEDFDRQMTYSYSKMLDGQKVERTGTVWGWSSVIASNWDGKVSGTDVYTDRINKVGKQTIEYNVMGRTITKDFVVDPPTTATKDVDSQTQIEVQYEASEATHNIFDTGYATFVTGEETYRLYLNYSNYTFPSSVVHTSIGDGIIGSIKKGLYFNVIDANTKMKIDLFGCGTAERTINVVSQPTRYNMTLERTSETAPKLGVATDFKFVISNLNNGSGAGYTNLSVNYNVRIKPAMGGGQVPAIVGKDYTITAIDNFDIPNPMTGNISKTFKFTPKVAGEFLISVNIMNGATQIFTASYSANVATMPSTYSAGLSAIAEDHTATITFTQKTASSSVGDIVFVYTGLRAMINNVWVDDIDFDDLVMKVKVTDGETVTYVSWKEFVGTLKNDGVTSTTTFEVVFELKEGAPKGSYQLSFKAYQKGTDKEVCSQITARPNFV